MDQIFCNLSVFVTLETVFPPVFGHRLNAKVVKIGERVLMDVEVSGTPNPVVTWYKDEKPIDPASLTAHKLRSEGCCHTLIIEKGIFQWKLNDMRHLTNRAI